MTRTASAILAGLMLLWSACVIAVVDRSKEGRSWPIHSEYHKSMDFKSGGVINLENSNGDIEISGWAEDRVDVTAYRRRDFPSQAGIYFGSKRFSPVAIQTQRSGETVWIRTGEEGYKEEESFVHYIIKVPRSVRLDKVINGRGNILISGIYGQAAVEAKEGQVAIENYSGSLDIQLEAGNVMAELLDPRPQDGVRISVDRGDIVIYLEPGIGGHFFLETPAGYISSEIDLNQSLPAQKISSTTGDGGVTVNLTALQGDIKIRRVEESS